MEKQAYIPQVITWARAQGFEDIKANLPENDDFESPISYGRQQDDEEFIPDVTGKQFHEKSYFEVILKTSRTSRLISKLKLMSVLATRKEGKLYLMVPKGHLQFAKEIAKESQVVAQVVSLNQR
ncbi:hypothetical protein ACO2Q8_25535 [Larkinella sp. VNQ87]|uniref:hypothetical protein n=1 Tax=Larkinella sp. VNQ87 TaxID=3400921 RepID=UPI003C0B9A26